VAWSMQAGVKVHPWRKALEPVWVGHGLGFLTMNRMGLAA
jgi:hypothetical protein